MTKRILLAIALLFSMQISVEAQEVVKILKVDKIEYELYSNGTAQVNSGVKAKGEVVIPETMEYNKKNYKVTSIRQDAFWNCENLTSVVIPNSVTSIGRGAFDGCSKLKKIVLPDNDVEIVGGAVFGSYYGTLPEIVNHSGMGPHYLSDNWDKWFSYSNNKGYFDIRWDYLFSYYISKTIYKQINLWQKKKEYETTEQWKARVTEENRDKMVAKIIADGKRDFIEKEKPSKLRFTIGTYDADYGVFPVIFDVSRVLGPKDTVFVAVPMEEAQQFKDNKYNLKVTPTYGIVNDRLGILSCNFKWGDKVYKNPPMYVRQGDADMAINLSPLNIDLGIGNNSTKTKIVTIDNSLDKDIPVGPQDNTKTFAVIIGNENYKRVAKVDYALNDGKVFAEYCKKTLGLPTTNVKLYENATFGDMVGALSYIKQVSAAYSGDINVLFYYAGHGIPDETTKCAYLLPVDADGGITAACLSVDNLYKELGALNAKNVVVLMDACFSGAQRGDGMLASARGVALKSKVGVPQGNMVVLTAATAEQTAYPYKEKGHGLFTYFLLKKLQETKGETTLGELSDFIMTNVKEKSIVVNGKLQTPTISTSAALGEDGKGWRLR